MQIAVLQLADAIPAVHRYAPVDAASVLSCMAVFKSHPVATRDAITGAVTLAN